MLSFYDHENYKGIIKGLIEANIQEPRYSDGSMVVLKSDKISAFNGKVSFTADSSTVFVKVALNPEASNETIGDGSPQVTLDVFSDVKQSNKISTITWAQNPNDYYNHLVQSDGITWGKATSTLETAQCIGVFYDGSDDWSTEKGRKKAEQSIIGVLSKGEDWHPKGKSELLNKLSTLPVGDFATLMDLIRGMNEFVSDIVKFSPLHIIHGSIDSEYKKNEEKNPLVQVSGVKDNTADMIICTSLDLGKKIASETVTYDSNGICTTSGGIKFVQVSLKKAKEGAQLGKVTSALLAKHGIASAMSIYRQVVEEEYHPDYVQFINEGWMGDFVKNSLSTLKKGASAIAQKFGNFISGARKLFQGWIKGFKGVWKQETNSAIKDFSRLFNLDSRDVKQLTEALDSYVDTGKLFLSEAREASINDALRGAKPGDITKFVNSIDNRTSNLSSLYDQHWYLDHMSEGGGLQLGKINKSFTVDVAIKLLANEVSLRTLNKIFAANAGNIDQLVKDMVDVQKEIYFGKTALPLYKVYGKAEVGSTYEYLGTAAEFAAKKESQIGSGSDLSFPISGFHVSSQAGKYYNIECWIITGVKDGVSQYAQMRMGTNKAGAFSYVVEGTKTRDLTKYNTKFRKK
tara:strand:- start:1100 stop:2989 length:1890 start_codon:yes stop_codon:yes gene_type:complete